MERPKRPENYDFCLSVLGDPEETELNDYVEALEDYCDEIEDENEHLAQYIEALMV
jgi:hypothetical protein